MSQPITKQIAQGAIKVLEQYGWCQGEIGNEEKGYCTIGAIAKSAQRILGDGSIINTFGIKERTWSHAYKCTCKKHPHPDIAVWNDEEDRTKEEVIKALEEIG